MKAKSFIKDHIFDESLFRYIYVLSLFLSFVCLIEVPAQIATYTLMAWGIVLIVHKLCTRSSYITYLPLLLAFIISGLITSFLHIHDNFLMNLLMMLHISICFFLFYALFVDDDKMAIKSELVDLFSIIVKISTALSGVGLFVAIFFPQTEILGYRIGLMDNRYTGLYTNPNLSAFVSVIAIVFCHYLLRKKCTKNGKRVIPIWLAVTCFVVNTLTLLLSDSNSSLVFLLLYIFFYTACEFYHYFRCISKKLIPIKAILIVLAFIVLCFGSYVFRLGCQNTMALIMNNVHNIEYEVSETGDNSTNLISLGRASEDRDVTSGRSDSWSKSMILIQENPIMGIGKGNITEYANRYLARGLNFSDLHNGYLTILVSTGFVGFSIFLIFSIMVARRIIVVLLERLRNNDGKDLAILVSMLCAYCAYAFFEKALLFDITFMVVVFWLILGYSMAMIPNRKSSAIYNINNFVLKLVHKFKNSKA